MRRTRTNVNSDLKGRNKVSMKSRTNCCFVHACLPLQCCFPKDTQRRETLGVEDKTGAEGHGQHLCSPVHKVAGAVNGVHNPGGAWGEHTLGPCGRSLFCNEPVMGRKASAQCRVPLTKRSTYLLACTSWQQGAPPKVHVTLMSTLTHGGSKRAGASKDAKEGGAQGRSSTRL